MARWRATWITIVVFSGAEGVSDTLVSPFFSSYPITNQQRKRYAHKYQCPQIFCFDHGNLLMLQFRARDATRIKDANCEVDCWVFPRRNEGDTPLRYALYRLLLQGFRRCQGHWPMANMSLRGVTPHHREFYNGQPVWKMADGRYSAHPEGCYRKVDASYGAFYWVDPDGNEELDEQGNRMWDTEGFGENTQATGQQQHGGYQQGGAYAYPQAEGYSEDFYV